MSILDLLGLQYGEKVQHNFFVQEYASCSLTGLFRNTEHKSIKA